MRGHELYALDHGGKFPSNAQGLKILYEKPNADAAWKGPYAEGKSEPKDVWGTPIQYAEPLADGESRKPSVWSYGPDKLPNTADDIR